MAERIILHGTYIHVRREEKSDMTEAGILIPETVEAPRQPRAIVEDVGPDCEFLKKGDKVLIPPSAGFIVELNDGLRLVCREEDIICRIAGKRERSNIIRVTAKA